MGQEHFVMHADCVSSYTLLIGCSSLRFYSHPWTIDYAKLMRKRDKAAGPDGKPPNIDLEMLRASTRMADNNNRDANNRNNNTTSNNNNNGNQSVSANTSAETKPAPSSPSQKSDSTRPSPAVSKAGPRTPTSPATGTYHSNPSGPGVPPQQQPSRATQMMPPPSIASGTGDNAPPTWPAARGYPAGHGPFIRPHASQSHSRGAPQ